MIEPEHPRLSIVRQCELISISRSAFYGPVQGESALNLELMRLIDAQFLETPWYGSRQMARHLRRLGYEVGRKRVGLFVICMQKVPLRKVSQVNALRRVLSNSGKTPGVPLDRNGRGLAGVFHALPDRGGRPPRSEGNTATVRKVSERMSGLIPV
jgi:hypothetical protein